VGTVFILVVRRTNVRSSLSSIFRYKPEEDTQTIMDGRMKKMKIGVIAIFVKGGTYFRRYRSNIDKM
jgi:hypothetical protein